MGRGMLEMQLTSGRRLQGEKRITGYYLLCTVRSLPQTPVRLCYFRLGCAAMWGLRTPPLLLVLPLAWLRSSRYGYALLVPVQQNAVLESCLRRIPVTVLQFDPSERRVCTVTNTHGVGAAEAVREKWIALRILWSFGNYPTLQSVLTQSCCAKDHACSSPHCNHPGSCGSVASK